MQLYQLEFPNGKKYIGITSKTAEERFKQHCNAFTKYPCQLAIHKYGKENVIVTVLEECDDWDALCLLEIKYIKKLKTFGKNGYNLTLGGKGIIKPKKERCGRIRQFSLLTHGNKGNTHAAKPPTARISLRVPVDELARFESLAGGKGKVLNKWILEQLKKEQCQT